MASDFKPNLKKIYLELNRRRAELQELKRRQSEPIAVIGMGCRFPGGANNPSRFWYLLRQGQDAVAEIPSHRWNADAYYDEDPATPCKMMTRHAAMIDDVDCFDAEFFGISSREASSLDPQQRLVLEVSWQALEHAGIAPDSLTHSQGSIYLGITCFDHALLNGKYPEKANCYTGTGSALNMAVGRLAYILGWMGPSMAIDTACSSSLVALHLACTALRAGECTISLVGGVHLILSPEVMVSFSQAHMLSADGRCKTFSAQADGYGRGEGCGMVVLKRLSDATKQGHKILAVIKGTAVNQDGPSGGLTIPNGKAQQAVILSALKQAGLREEEVDYVETHGTGTPLGDPIETEALRLTLGQNRQRPLWLGSVKTNIGHLESAAGVAGLIKVVLSLQKGELPAHLHFQQANTHIQWGCLKVPTKLMAWPSAPGKKMIAGLSAFGFSGTNAHALLEEGSATEVEPEGAPFHLLALSAKHQQALGHLAKSYLPALASEELGPLCFHANHGRAHFDARLCVVATSSKQATRELSLFTKGAASAVHHGTCNAQGDTRIAFVFTGQGSQYEGMGQQLFAQEAVFRESLLRCERILADRLPQPLIAVIFAGKQLDETRYAQPVLFALAYALCQQWSHWGIKPAVVLGHSIGEYVAAHVAGVFTLEDAFTLVLARASLMQELPKQGSMAALALPCEQVLPYLQHTKQTAIAAINEPTQTVISGAVEEVEQILASCEAKGIRTKRLTVSHAFHSPLMSPILEPYRAVAQMVTYSPPQIPLISNLNGQRVGNEICSPDYWIRHVMEPVRFADSLQTLNQMNVTAIVEVGSQPTLSAIGTATLPESIWLPSLRPFCEDALTIRESLARLYIKGVKVNWQKVTPQSKPLAGDLPSYPFERTRYPITPCASAEAKSPLSALLKSNSKDALLQQLEESQSLTDQQRQNAPAIIEKLMNLASQRRSHQAAKHRIYQPQWQRRPQMAVDEQTKTGTVWLVFAPQDRQAEPLITRLEQRGDRVIVVKAGTQFETKTWGYRLDPEQPQHFTRLFAEVGPIEKILHLWSMELSEASTLTEADLTQATLWSCVGMLHLTQSLQQLSESRAQLWLITRDAVPAGQGAAPISGLAQTPLWGFTQVARMEYPHRFAGNVDMPAAPTDADWQALIEELTNGDGEDLLAFRDGERFAMRLLRHRARTPQLEEQDKDLQLDGEAAYLITGGTGALGLAVAKQFVACGARHLILTSRKGQMTQQSQQGFAAQGVEVNVRASDVTNSEQVAQLLDALPNRQIKGVVHAAGLPGMEAIATMTPGQLAEVLAPKTVGAWQLHKATSHLALDFFLCFSSVASVWGSKHQAHYTAANRFLDGLCQHRAALGLPAKVINWGPWAQGGMTTEKIGDLLQSLGLTPLEPGEAMAGMAQILGETQTQMLYADVDWTRFRASFEIHGKRFLLDEIEASKGPDVSHSSELTPIVSELKALPEAKQYDQLHLHVRQRLGEILRHDQSEMPDPARGFSEMGMDSLMAIEFAKCLQEDLGCRLNATLTFDYPNVSKVTSYLAELMGLKVTVEDDVEETFPNGQLDLAIDQLEELSEEDAEQLLMRKLGLTGDS